MAEVKTLNTAVVRPGNFYCWNHHTAAFTVFVQTTGDSPAGPGSVWFEAHRGGRVFAFSAGPLSPEGEEVPFLKSFFGSETNEDARGVLAIFADWLDEHARCSEAGVIRRGLADG